MKEVLHNPEVDALLSDKLTNEQQTTLSDFKDVIFEAKKKGEEN